MATKAKPVAGLKAAKQQKDQAVLDLLKAKAPHAITLFDLFESGLGEASLKRLVAAGKVIRTRVPVPQIKRIGNPRDRYEFHYQLAWDGAARRAAGA